MFKNILFILFFTLTSNVASCQTSVNSEQQVLTGISNVRILERGVAYRWYKDGYFNYQPNLSAVEVIKQAAPNVSFIIFAGTWCIKSRDILPHFFKTMDLAGIARQRITLCFLDRDFRSLAGFESVYGIYSTPVIIVLNEKAEIGRITENISHSVEADIADVLPQK